MKNKGSEKFSQVAGWALTWVPKEYVWFFRGDVATLPIVSTMGSDGRVVSSLATPSLGRGTVRRVGYPWTPLTPRHRVTDGWMYVFFLSLSVRPVVTIEFCE